MTETNIHPQRLVMMKFENSCMFCDEPEAPSYSYYVCLYSKMGYISCDKCKGKCKDAITNWEKNIAYGQANYLKEKTIKIKRSPVNGLRAIEEGWTLDNPITALNNDGKETIHCYNPKKDMARWCLMDEILELNPLAPASIAHAPIGEETAD